MLKRGWKHLFLPSADIKKKLEITKTAFLGDPRYYSSERLIPAVFAMRPVRTVTRACVTKFDFFIWHFMFIDKGIRFKPGRGCSPE